MFLGRTTQCTFSFGGILSARIRFSTVHVSNGNSSQTRAAGEPGIRVLTSKRPPKPWEPQSRCLPLLPQSFCSLRKAQQSPWAIVKFSQQKIQG
jgi:hypothetical protein